MAGRWRGATREGTTSPSRPEPTWGPTPYDALPAALGGCTAMTVRLYARRKVWPLDEVTVALRHDRIHAAVCASCISTEGRVDRIAREITIETR